MGRSQDAEVTDDYKERVSSGYTQLGSSTDELREVIAGVTAESTRPVHAQPRLNSDMGNRGGCRVQSLAENSLVIGSCWERES